MLNSNLISKSYQIQESDASFKVYFVSFEGRGNDYAPITSLCSDLNEIYRETEY